MVLDRIVIITGFDKKRVNNSCLYVYKDVVFEQVKPIIMKIFEGHNATLFAYGQTGSGKTHTINGSQEAPGIIQRSIKALLSHIHSTGIEATVRASYLEIYNDKIYDLLTGNRDKCLDLRETANKQIVVAGLTNVRIASVNEFIRNHDIALANRSTAATNLNEASSRSHFIMQISVDISTASGSKTITSKLNLIDLAGSEDNKRTGNVGARMVESGAINKSLFVLGQVVEALNKSQQRAPYRDSKITRFLQDSLGGSSLGLIIACCSPGQTHFIDTYNTLNFATKSSLIKNSVMKNEAVVKIDDQRASRKHELEAWKQQKANTSMDGPSKKPRLSNSSDKSEKEYAKSQFDQMVKDKVEAQVQLRMASLKREILSPLLKCSNILNPSEALLQQTDAKLNHRNTGNNPIGDAERRPLGATWKEALLKQANEAEASGKYREAALMLKRAYVLVPKEDHDEKHSILVRVVGLERKLEPSNEASQMVAFGRNDGLDSGPEIARPISLDERVAEDPKLDTLKLLKQATEDKIMHIINNGSEKEILKLKQIGKSRVKKVIEAKILNGPFAKFDDLHMAGFSKAQLSSILKVWVSHLICPNIVHESKKKSYNLG